MFWSAATLGAPQTTSISSLPVLTTQSRSRSALGWGRTSVTWPTKTSVQPPMTSTSPTSMPAMVSRWANSGAGRSTSTYCLSQLRGIFICYLVHRQRPVSGGHCKTAGFSLPVDSAIKIGAGNEGRWNRSGVYRQSRISTWRYAPGPCRRRNRCISQCRNQLPPTPWGGSSQRP